MALGLISQNAITIWKSPGNPGDIWAKLEPAPNAAHVSEAISEPPAPVEPLVNCSCTHDTRWDPQKNHQPTPAQRANLKLWANTIVLLSYQALDAGIDKWDTYFWLGRDWQIQQLLAVHLICMQLTSLYSSRGAEGSEDGASGWLQKRTGYYERKRWLFLSQVFLFPIWLFFGWLCWVLLGCVAEQNVHRR